MNKAEDEEALLEKQRHVLSQLNIKVIIHKKICKEVGNCKVIVVKSILGQEIKLAILRNAAILKENETTIAYNNNLL